MQSLQKIPVNINFAKGVDEKSDPKQIPIGKFASLVNRVFGKTGLLEKRNGFGVVTTISGATTLATFQDNLVAVGNTLEAYSADTNSSVSSGFFQPLKLTTVPMVRSATSQTTCDVAIASNGLACSTWLDSDASSYYQISDSVTGQAVVPSVALPSTATMSRVFCLGQYFIVTFLATVSAASHLQYIAIPIANPSNPSAAVDIATTPSALTAAYDGAVYANYLYLAWNKAATIGITSLNTSLQVQTPLSLAGNTADLMSVTIDTTGSPVVWITWWNSGGTVIKTTAYNQALNSTPILAVTSVVTSITCNEITSTAQSNSLEVFYEVANTYAFSPNTKTDYIAKNSCTIAGAVGSPANVLRGVGLASKATLVDGSNYMLACYGQTYQPTYYLIDSSGNVLSKLAYSNGIGYATNQILPQMSSSDSVIRVGYLFKDFLAPVNKTQGVANVNGVYSQTGINLAYFELGAPIYSSEIAKGLHLTGGLLWLYDGVKAVEHGFNVWPEDLNAIGNSATGSVTAQAYFYKACYEWTDAQGNLHRSAPSVPLSYTVATPPANFTANRTSGSPTLAAVSSFTGLQIGQLITGTGIPASTYITALNTGASTITMSANASSGAATATTVTPAAVTSINVYVPTLRQTYKTANKVRIVIYRWSTAQQNYYRITSISAPTLNNPAVDYVTYADSAADSSILGNDLIYTTGGVIENIGAPALTGITLFDNRVWGIDAEDQNLLWYSKQCIENVPVELSDLLTYFVAPTTGAKGSTGPILAIAPMDDKLIVFKRNALYYVNGSGPDNTGANSQYSQPIYINSPVGCANPNSIVIMPNGIMFQSDNGIWILNRNLSVLYIGSAVEDSNAQVVTSAITIPGTTQVRFTLDNRTALMYDYFYDQWGTFENVNAISSTLYGELHTYLNQYGQIVQETPGVYLDISNPVLTSFKTGWINLAGLRGYQRFYRLFLLGDYISPHRLQLQFAYNYNPGISQTVMIDPINFSGTYGDDANYGDSPAFGGVSNIEEWEIFPKIQKCQAFQITMNEFYDSTLGVPAGAGLTLSGLSAIAGFKKGYAPIKSATSAG